MSIAAARASTEPCGSYRGEHSSASCSKTRTRMEAEFEVRPSRVRSSHKLASCRGRQHSWTASIWILEAWTRANLAQSDGKCRAHATAPLSLPEVEACGPVLSFGLSDTLSFRSFTCLHAPSRHEIKESITWIHTCTYHASRLITSLTSLNILIKITRLWCFETHVIDSRLKEIIIMMYSNYYIDFRCANFT